MPGRMTTPNEILRTALQKEMQARDFYAELGVNCSIDFVKNLLQTLQNEESKHVDMIQKMIVKLESS